MYMDANGRNDSVIYKYDKIGATQLFAGGENYGFMNQYCNTPFTYLPQKNHGNMFDTNRYECNLQKYYELQTVNKDSLVFYLPNKLVENQRYTFSFKVKNLIYGADYLLKDLQVFIIYDDHRSGLKKKMVKKISFESVGEQIDVNIDFQYHVGETFFVLNTLSFDEFPELKNELRILESNRPNKLKKKYKYFLTNKEQKRAFKNYLQDFFYVITEVSISQISK